MTDEDRKMFCEICYAFFFMDHGPDSMSPSYIMEKAKRRDQGAYIWAGLHALLQRNMEKYCNKWHLPLEDWLNDLQFVFNDGGPPTKK